MIVCLFLSVAMLYMILIKTNVLVKDMPYPDLFTPVNSFNAFGTEVVLVCFCDMIIYWFDYMNKSSGAKQVLCDTGTQAGGKRAKGRCLLWSMC